VRTITILPSGEVEFLGDACPVDLPLANPIKRRASRIEPTRFWKRKSFQALRLVAGESGRVASFTRTWAGSWTAVILATGQTATFNTRAEAIAWEISVLE
jgi:hypothetical protein